MKLQRIIELLSRLALGRTERLPEGQGSSGARGAARGYGEQLWGMWSSLGVRGAAHLAAAGRRKRLQQRCHANNGATLRVA